jgi:hypothetical protein
MSAAPAIVADHAVYLRRCQEAKNRGRRVDVVFRLDDDSRTEQWLVHPGQILHTGFWTSGRFFIAYKRVESLREDETEEEPIAPRVITAPVAVATSGPAKEAAPPGSITFGTAVPVMLTPEQYEALLWEWWAGHGWTLDRVMRLLPFEAKTAMEGLLQEHKPMLGGMVIDKGPVGLRYGPPGALAKNRREIRSHSIIARAYDARWTNETKGLPKHTPGKRMPDAVAPIFRELLADFLAESERRAGHPTESWDFGHTAINEWVAVALRRRVDQDVVKIYQPDYRTFIVIDGRIYTATAVRKFLEKEIVA